MSENKVIFGSKEEFEKALKDMNSIGTIKNSDITYLVNQANKKGYIRKSVVEEAEEMYNNYNSAKGCTGTHRDIIEKLYEAIQELKQRLKNEAI